MQRYPTSTEKLVPERTYIFLKQSRLLPGSRNCFSQAGNPAQVDASPITTVRRGEPLQQRQRAPHQAKATGSVAPGGMAVLSYTAYLCSILPGRLRCLPPPRFRLRCRTRQPLWRMTPVVRIRANQPRQRCNNALLLCGWRATCRSWRWKCWS